MRSPRWAWSSAPPRVIWVVTIGLTGKQYILQELQKIETNSVELEYAGGGATAAERVLYNDSLTRDDEKAVVNGLPGVMYSSPVLEMHDRINFGGGVVKDTLVLGVSPQYQHIRNLLVPVGRFFDDEDDADPHQVRRGHGEVCPGAIRQRRRRRRSRPSRSAAFRSPSSASSKRASTTSAIRRSQTRPS